MLSKREFDQARNAARQMLQKVEIAISPAEEARIEVADFGLNDLGRVGLQLLTYINTERVCAKELVLFEQQICPEHFHPPVLGEPGKEETFRCRWGSVYLYLPGEPTKSPKATVPQGYGSYLTVWHEICLSPGQQYTIWPNTLHWFQAGSEGAVVSEFSTQSRDEYDVFTDPRIIRQPQVAS